MLTEWMIYAGVISAMFMVLFIVIAIFWASVALIQTLKERREKAKKKKSVYFCKKYTDRSHENVV